MDAQTLRPLLHYDPETGVLTWLQKLASRQYVGDAAGRRNHDGYVIVGIWHKRYCAHRLAWLYMTGGWPEHEIDHVDRDRSNNRWGNLRPATHKQNAENRSPRHDSSSRFVGVLWSSRDQAWRTVININGRKRHIGTHKSLLDAVAHRISASRKYHTHSQFVGGA